MTRPLLLVDIDGVLNCFGNLGASLVNFEQEFTVEDQGRPYRIKVPDGASQGLQQLQQHFDCVWCTTWEEKSYLIGDRLGVGPWPHIVFPKDKTHEGKTNKLPEVVAYVEDRPCAWIDDDIHEDAYNWASARHSPTLLVQPQSNYGLTQAHLRQLLAWQQALS